MPRGGLRLRFQQLQKKPGQSVDAMLPAPLQSAAAREVNF